MFRMHHAMVVGYGLTPDRPMTVLMNGPMYHSAPNSYARGALILGPTSCSRRSSIPKVSSRLSRRTE